MDLLGSPELDVKLRTVQSSTVDLSTPDGRMLARIQVAVAKREVEHRQKRILSKVQELVEAGKIHDSGHRPFGYDRLYEGTGPRRKTIEDRLNAVEAKYVEEWADRALGGETLYSLVLDSVEKDIRTSTGGFFTYQAMRTLLRSGRISGRKDHKGVIVGKAVWPASQTPSGVAVSLGSPTSHFHSGWKSGWSAYAATSSRITGLRRRRDWSP